MLILKKQVRASILLIFIVLSFLNTTIFAQEEKETLNQRLDRLEKQNEELSKALKERLSATPSVSSKEDVDNLLLKIQRNPLLRMCLPFLLWELMQFLGPVKIPLQ